MIRRILLWILRKEFSALLELHSNSKSIEAKLIAEITKLDEASNTKALRLLSDDYEALVKRVKVLESKPTEEEE